MPSSGAGDQGAVRRRARTGADGFRQQLWPLPAVAIVAAVGLGVAMPELDRRVVERLPPGWTGYLFSGGPEAARGVLTAVAGSLITVVSLTFSITILTLQLASSQYSPRLLRTFTRDRVVRVTLAALLGTFTYALTVLRTVRSSSDTQAQFVPHLSVTIAYVLALASVILVVVFLAHLAQKLRAESTLRDVHAESSRNIQHALAERSDAPGQAREWPQLLGKGRLVCADTSGILVSLDTKSLVQAAERADALISIDHLPGDYIIGGAPVARLWARSEGPLDEDVLESLRDSTAGAIRTGFERTMAHDIAFGLRQLTDVAVKAVSSGDPTTAVHALGHVSALICEAAGRELGPRVLHDSTGQPRVLIRQPELAGMLDLVVGQPLHYGGGDAQVTARLLAMLREVAWVTRAPNHHEAIRRQLARVRDAVAGMDFEHTNRAELDAAAVAVEHALRGEWHQPSKD